MELSTVWFGLIAVLFIGYFVLEGFDFGVGILTKVLAHNERERRVLVNTIGPVWDGNEVWVLTAGGAMFAAFPEWYATLFSGFYLPLLVILVALIGRGVAFEYRGKRDNPRWRTRWDQVIFWGSLLPALLWGVAFANVVRGVPLDTDHEFVGTLWGLLNPYALLGGLTTLGLFVMHGTVFLALKTVGEIRLGARRFATRLGPVVAVLAVVFLGWTQLQRGDVWSAILAVAAAVSFLVGWLAITMGREGWAFVASAAAIALAVTTLFVALYPDVMPTTLDDGASLTVDNASSTPYTLTIMTWVAVIFTPIVLLYQGWTYWVFRKRIGIHHIPEVGPPATVSK
jgi:cytochrome bd ubiquinol oxidase subunit II